MPYHYWVALPILISILLSGCSRPAAYKPSLSLGKSPVTIRAKAQVEPFVDESPAEDDNRNITGVGFPPTIEPWNTRYLARQVTEAVINDFSINGVFQEVGQSVDNPDIIVRGEIHRFHGEARLNTLGLLTSP